MIIKSEICSLCKKRIHPQGCDGNVYIPLHFSRDGEAYKPVCRGTDCASFVKEGSHLCFRIVHANGEFSHVALLYRPDL